jgi:hypothetical protein
LRGVVKPTAKRLGVNGEDNFALPLAPKAGLRGRAKALAAARRDYCSMSATDAEECGGSYHL